MTPDILLRLLVAFALILVVARLAGWLAERVGQPAVVGEICAGILLGPTLLSGELTRLLFPSEVRPPLRILADVGVVLFMFLVGLELNEKLLRGQGKAVAGTALGSMAVPFVLGVALALYLVDKHPTGDRLAFVLFLGTAMSVTAFPVLARILGDRGLMETRIGALALACAAVGDVLAWTLLAVVAALAGGAVALWWQLLFVVPFAVLLVFVMRPALTRLGDRWNRGRPGVTRRRRAGVLAVVAAGLALSAGATEWMGLHLIFGAFLFGVAMPRRNWDSMHEWTLPWVRRVASLLLPVFFAVAGLAVDLSEVGGSVLGELALVLLVAIGGKGLGAYIGARLSGIPVRSSAILAILLNTRGLTELIALTVGLQLGLLDTALYSLLVVMALVTTAMTGALMPLVHSRSRGRPEAQLRILPPGVQSGS
ncbi:cation:proton antiporter [Nocardia carnea]|uniref:Cation:proton antiporter n=1 Tax=Nocardia carnea TaxID=37328 RepID=A0ABW7TL49_9NOCA|nr:cation:proton antiporter [Nocardia carnea]